MSMEQLRDALQANIRAQQECSIAMEQIIYLGKEAHPDFIAFGKDFVWGHQDRIEMIEIEIDRRQRLELFKSFYEEICKKHEAQL